MTVSAALPEKISKQDGSILTFVVPAPDGCNLSCPFCVIRQRRELATDCSLSAYGYYKFILDAAEKEPITAICIQGYEPLLPSSFEYMWSILRAGRRLGIPTSVVTNGIRLADWVNELRDLEPDKIAVSLDAATPEGHDRLRGEEGAWVATVNALQCAVTSLSPKTELVVSSVLIPKRREQLDGIPALLNDIGIKRWVVNVLQKIGKDKVGGPVGEQPKIFRDLIVLKDTADCYGINFVVDDEFGSLQEAELSGSVVGIDKLRIKRLPSSASLFRLLPTGQCSMGTDILKQVSHDAPVWAPDIGHAGDFLTAMRSV